MRSPRLAFPIATNVAVGLVIGTLGGLIGLGGAELRLPYLVGVLRLTAHQAVPVNLAISLVTVLAAIPVRLIAMPSLPLASFVWETAAIATGAVVAAWIGTATLKHLSARTLGSIIFILLVVLGAALLIEAAVALTPSGFLPDSLSVRLAAALVIGALIGAISSLLGVAGGEIIIPTLVFAYGAPIKVAGSLSMMISLPTVLTGIIRHAHAGAFSDRSRTREIIVPMGLGAATGAIVGGLLLAITPVAAIKLGLGLILMWSAWKVFGQHGSRKH